MLNGYPILIAEDDGLIAVTLVDAVEQLEGHPVGPVPTVSEAMALLETETIAAAIVDANLLDRDVTPLALALVAKKIPFVVYTGKGLPDELAQLLPELPVVLKPASPTKVLAALLNHASPDRELFR